MEDVAHSNSMEDYSEHLSLFCKRTEDLEEPTKCKCMEDLADSCKNKEFYGRFPLTRIS